MRDSKTLVSITAKIAISFRLSVSQMFFPIIISIKTKHSLIFWTLFSPAIETFSVKLCHSQSKMAMYVTLPNVKNKSLVIIYNISASILEMFSDTILKLINNSVFYNYTLNLTNAFLTLPLTLLCTMILFDKTVTVYTNFFYCSS